MGDGGVFRRHAEGVPTHGMEDVETLHPLVAGDDVPDGIVADMTDMNLPGRVGEHFQEIILFLAGIFLCRKGLLLFPVTLPFLFNLLGGVFDVHR